MRRDALTSAECHRLALACVTATWRSEWGEAEKQVLYDLLAGCSREELANVLLSSIRLADVFATCWGREAGEDRVEDYLQQTALKLASPG